MIARAIAEGSRKAFPQREGTCDLREGTPYVA